MNKQKWIETKSAAYLNDGYDIKEALKLALNDYNYTHNKKHILTNEERILGNKY